ncbi:MAG: chemotaxis protein CheD [Candidatus Hodarchaeales archaeon]
MRSTTKDITKLQNKTKYIGIGELELGFEGEILKIAALGSCIGLVFYPSKRNIKKCAVMAHIMLSESPDSKKSIKRWGPAKYADLAIPRMINLLEKEGIPKNKIEAKMVGGARMSGHGSITLRIGENNIFQVKNLLKEYKIPLKDSYTGGDTGMSVKFHIDSYLLIVTPTGGTSVYL